MANPFTSALSQGYELAQQKKQERANTAKFLQERMLQMEREDRLDTRSQRNAQNISDRQAATQASTDARADARNAATEQTARMKNAWDQQKDIISNYHSGVLKPTQAGMTLAPGNINPASAASLFSNTGETVGDPTGNASSVPTSSMSYAGLTQPDTGVGLTPSSIASASKPVTPITSADTAPSPDVFNPNINISRAPVIQDPNDASQSYRVTGPEEAASDEYTRKTAAINHFFDDPANQSIIAQDPQLRGQAMMKSLFGIDAKNNEDTVSKVVGEDLRKIHNPAYSPKEQADAEYRVKLIHKDPVAPINLTPEAVQGMADRFKITGETLPGMGMARTNAQMINQAFADQHTTGEDVAQAQAEYRGERANYANLTKMAGSLDTFEQTYGANMDRAMGLLDKVTKTGSKWLNTPLAKINRNALGSDDQAAFDAAMYVANSEGARVLVNMGQSGILSDSARTEGNHLADKDLTASQLKHIVGDVMLPDARTRRVAMHTGQALSRDKLAHPEKYWNGAMPLENSENPFAPIPGPGITGPTQGVPIGQGAQVPGGGVSNPATKPAFNWNQ